MQEAICYSGQPLTHPCLRPIYPNLLQCCAAEDMLAAVAHATGSAIGIAVERLETVSLAGLPEHLFTTDMSAAHIRYNAWARDASIWMYV